jgi:nucleolin
VKKPAANGKKAAAKKKDSSDDEDSDEDSEDEQPKKAVRKQSNVSKKSAKKDSDDEDDFEEVKGDEDADKKELFVGNIAFGTTEDSLAAGFSEYGTIVNMKLPLNERGQPKGFAFVEYATHKEAKAALDAFNG